MNLDIYSLLYIDILFRKLKKETLKNIHSFLFYVYIIQSQLAIDNVTQFFIYVNNISFSVFQFIILYDIFLLNIICNYIE